jgi:hypothetical protein
MTSKKKLITRMALWTAVVLAVALLTAGVALGLMHTDRQRWEDRQKRERQALIDRTREYLTQLARKIDKLPVDPNLVGEIESRYFEEQASGPLYVWAMGTDGKFLFGVPHEAFARLNAIYDREIVPRLEEGLVIDRQTFLRSLVDQSDRISPKEFAADRLEDGDEAWEEWQRYRRGREGAFVLSAPLKTAEGAPLGNLYVKRRAPVEREYYQDDQRLQAMGGVAGGVAVVAFAFLWILLPTWVYVDARERGARRAPLFAFLTVLSSLIGLVVYLIARPEGTRTLSCPACAREVNGGAFCPHCGQDLSASFCPACRYPLKPDWAFCPACRTEIRPPSTPPAPEAASS